MKIKAGLLAISSLVLTLALSGTAMAGNGKGNSAAAKAGKVDICHLTSSAKNPSVLINVSQNAAQAHYDHGDPEEFDILANGKCAPLVEEPPVDPEPADPFEVCAVLDFAGGQFVWTLEFDPADGGFSGIDNSATLPMTGTVTPAGDLFEAGKTVEFSVDVFTGESTEFSDVIVDGAVKQAFFDIAYLIDGEVQGLSLLKFDADCANIDIQDPR